MEAPFFGTIEEEARYLTIHPVEIASLMQGKDHIKIEFEPIVNELNKVIIPVGMLATVGGKFYMLKESNVRIKRNKSSSCHLNL